jgi:hypothetical protein
VPRTHDLDRLIYLLMPIDVTLAKLRRCARSLGRYAVDFRYPGSIASKRQMAAALRHAESIRAVCRDRLGLTAT